MVSIFFPYEFIELYFDFSTSRSFRFLDSFVCPIVYEKMNDVYKVIFYQHWVFQYYPHIYISTSLSHFRMMFKQYKRVLKESERI